MPVYLFSMVLMEASQAFSVLGIEIRLAHVLISLQGLASFLPDCARMNSATTLLPS